MKLTGYFYLIVATAIYGFFGVFSRHLTAFGPFSQGVVRFGIVCTFLLSLFLFKKVAWRKIEKKDIKWFLAWSLPASIQPILTFYCFTHLSIGLSYFLIYSAMVIGGILSGMIFFSEKLNFYKITSLVLISLGLWLIYRSDILLLKSIFVFIALLSGLILGFWNTLSKKVSNKYPEFQMILWDGSFTLIVSIIGTIAAHNSFPPFSDISTWVWVIAFAFFGIMATLMTIKGFKYIEAQVGSLIMPTELVFASIFSFLFLNELLKEGAYLGGFLILIAAVFPVLGSFRKTAK